MKTLLLMRHAKSDWNAGARSDHDRPLNERGLAAARFMGSHLTDSGLAPDHVISSTAVRAITTAKLAAESGAWGAEIEPEARLYGSGAAEVISVAADRGRGGTLMLVGHQPTWSMLVAELSGEMAEMKTATVAVIDFTFDSWSALGGEIGQLRDVLHPREIM